MNFQLPEMTKAKCTHTNTRKEKRGKRDVLAIDMDIECDMSNEILTVFAPDLLSSMYLDDGQQPVAGTDRVLKIFRFPKMKLPIGWEVQLSGITFECDYGLGEEGNSNLWLEGCKVGKFKMTPKEGGTVSVAFQVQNATDALDTDMLGKLNGLILAPYIQIRLLPSLEVAGAGDDKGAADSDFDDPDDNGPLFKDPPAGEGDPEDPAPPMTAGDIFVANADQKPNVPVIIKKGRKVVKPVKASKPSKLGTDADQQERQDKILAADERKAKAGTPSAAAQEAADLP